MEDYEIVIGLEVHVELLTKTKMFCSCLTEFGAPPNTHVCPVCTGMPGVLPVINKRAVELALKTAIVFNSEISRFCRFARKNYFYPDLPKNYQISQYEEPLAKGGYLEIDGKRIRFKRIHLEEDAGKLLHSETGFISFVDFNRSGIPLLEMVTEPDIGSPEEAEKFLEKLKQILEYLEISDCNMEEGSLRCDANISVRKKGTKELGVKTEVKNMNSFKSVRKALAYESKRQIEILKRGEKIVQETRLWNEKEEITESMRTKEEAHDYRYFPEPDLVPLEINDGWIEEIRKEIKEMPDERKERFKKDYGISDYDANVLISHKGIADYFEECVKLYNNPKVIANWIMSEILAQIKGKVLKKEEIPLKPEYLVDILKLIEENKITVNTGKEILKEVYNTGLSPCEIVEKKNLLQIQDIELIGKFVEEVIRENEKAINDWKKGKQEVISFLVGQVMRKTKGRANPNIVRNILIEYLKSLK
ncbi:MAG: Asp-tRNA(Asn)/Glu-tRNA(Gln) amidotransferase subunit GatB [candidate division WOR-3 bacterium]|nr:Asp-tRNA(Asn)/Glu-tRNA(Gln) amidotransferase subunit GatB [Candidatus Omnitrophota bacterium]MCM8807160.1 Asp-tRNA(Asn)/Glu-tRNA(Gln) amidotransferase subunit GatB [Candidatus Omnitrophota bacterium]